MAYGKRKQRFIVLKKDDVTGKWVRSVAISQPFYDKALAHAAIVTDGMPGVQYKIRTK
jgi:hypothetical protein